MPTTALPSDSRDGPGPGDAGDIGSPSFAATVPADPDQLAQALDGSIDRRVLQAQVEQAFSRLRSSIIWSVAITLATAIYLPFVPTARALTWIGLLLAVQGLRAVLQRTFEGLRPAERRLDVWSRLFVLAAAAAGLSWGLGPLLLVEGAGRPETFLPVTAVMAVCAVAVAQLCALWPALVAFLVGALVPTAIVLVWRGGPVEQAGALVVVTAMVMLMMGGRSLNRVNEALIRAELGKGLSLTRTRRLASDLARASMAREVEGRRLAAIVEGMAAGTVDWDITTGHMQVNERWARMLGYTRAELEPLDGERFMSLLHPDDRRPIAQDWQLHLNGGVEGIDRELRFAHRSGRWVWMQVKARIVDRDAEGRATSVSGVYLDISGRKATEHRWRTRAEMSADWFWETDEAFRVTLLSDGVRHRLPIPHEDLLGRTLADVPALRPLEAGWGDLGRRLAALEPFSDFACEITAPDGDKRIVELDGRPRHDDRGVFLGYEGVGRDVTTRRRATESLRESLALVDALFEATPIPVIVKDTQGRYVRTNRAYHETLARNGGKPIQHVSEIVDEKAAALHQAVDDELMSRPGIRHYEVRQHLDSGRTLNALIHKATLVGADGTILGLVATMHDLTDQYAAADALQAAKEAAESANRAKSAFLATMSHELRTPLNAVIGAAQLLRTVGDPVKHAELIHSIEASGTALLGLIENVMDLSRIEAGAMELSRTPFDLAECVQTALSTVRVQAQVKGVALTVRMDLAPSAMRLGDAARLRQVLVNLLHNAVKFTPRGEVELEVRTDPGQIDRMHVEVRDSGIGIVPALQASIFEPFRQADEGTTRRYGGSGLGLAIVRQLVQAMGGTVQVRSEPGQGSCFFFDVNLPVAADATADLSGRQGAVSRLPAPASRAAVVDTQPAAPPGADGSAAHPQAASGKPRGNAEGSASPGGPASPTEDPPVRVLLVEDDETNRIIIAALLEPMGCTMVLCENGAAALWQLASQPFDVVLMDWQMPDLDGLEVSRRIRRGDAGEAARVVPILALTANAFAEDRVACLDAGMDDFLTKPVHAQVLRDAVQRWGAIGRCRQSSVAHDAPAQVEVARPA